MPDSKLARRAMIDSQLRPEAVTDAGVLDAMATVPREDYVPEAVRSFAYFDRSIPLGGGRSMMAPAALGRLLNELTPRAGEAALVVGAATGYAAAILSAIGLKVTAIESDAALADAARKAGVDVLTGVLAEGRADRAPYDLVLIDGAVEQVPDALVAQMAPHGRLGTAIDDRGVTRLVIGTIAGGKLGLRTIVDAGVAPLPGFERPRAFTFQS